MAQNGNVYEWGESGSTAPNDSAAESRVYRGGNWNNGSFDFAVFQPQQRQPGQREQRS